MKGGQVTVPGSTLHIATSPTLAFDMGSKYSAVLLREGIGALWGATLALTYPDTDNPNAILDEHERLRTYFDRIVETGLEALGLHYKTQARVRIVVEAHNYPTRGGKYGRIPLRDYVIPARGVTAITTAFPGAVILPPQRAGGRHKRSNGGTGNPADYYPAALIGRRPAEWGPNEHPEHIRDHEQAGYVLAGLAEQALNEQAVA